MKSRIRMSFFAKNLLFSSINIILIGTILIVSSYYIEKNILTDQLHQQIKTITEEWSKQIKPEMARASLQEQDFQGAEQLKLRPILDSVNQYNPNIAQAYVSGTELLDGNKTSQIAVPTALLEPLKEMKLTAKDMIEQPPVIVETLQSMMKTGEPTFSDIYSDDFGTWTTIAYPIKDETGAIFAYFAADADASAINSGLHELLTYSLLIMLVFLVIVLLVQYYVVRRTLSPIKLLMAGIEKVSAGDLDVEIAAGTDDLGIVNDKFNQMVRRMNGTMIKIQELSSQVAESAQTLYLTTEDNNRQAESIHHNVKMIADNILTQQQSARDSSRAITEMTTVIQSVAQNSSSLAEEAADMETKSEQGNSAVSNMVDQMSEISGFVNNVSQTVELLNQRSNEIGSILVMIRGIATQTNLLALNAAIEASRVGEHGRGFAVVAGEVRKLAEQSKESAEQISTLIDEIQVSIQHAAQSMEYGTGVVEKGMSLAHETSSLFTEISRATRNVSEQTQEVSSAAQEMSAATEELAASADELSATVDVTTSGTEKITHSVEAQQQRLSSIVEASNLLSSVAEKLKEQIETFRVKTK
ncbi:methyl-accepting chemotaxis protein [Paenibacillus sp. CCS19]|uniref:methyl-accepting chemotaxis protein n=1 Tax=Paenibacillus sp. CCS19 TaxID=3158387 RepID=UPI002565ADDE|nr:HAMP domain-containing methyl-accepting chemotaxis protein [Paenibacillus cellulosilyticus]GMK37680.1 methyl-accepting chemotaxis protein [Paenibacillus cellulosilyticus]